MPTPEVQSFFQGFNFDTLLALISCIAGVAALFVGGAAYNNCRIIKNSFNDKKKFEDNSQDHSQRAAGDIINNNGISDTQLVTITTALTTMNSTNFSEALDKAYTRFQEQCDENLKNIIDQTKQVITDNRLQISGYTKIDWIHIYLESAKNASDAYMQNVWAKVLAIELAQPGSFSYKTLDVLKNMSAEDYQMYEKLASLTCDGFIFKSKVLNQYLPWSNQLRLQEMGLINLDASERTITVSAKNTSQSLVCHKTMVLRIKNDTENELQVKHEVRVITSAANELLATASLSFYKQYFIDSIKEVKEDHKTQCQIELYDVVSVNDTQFTLSPIDNLSQ